MYYHRRRQVTRGGAIATLVLGAGLFGYGFLSGSMAIDGYNRPKGVEQVYSLNRDIVRWSHAPPSDPEAKKTLCDLVERRDALLRRPETRREYAEYQKTASEQSNRALICMGTGLLLVGGVWVKASLD